MIATAQQGEMLDALCWRIFGRTAAVTEQALALNPGIAAGGPRLPEGQQIILPDDDQSAPERLETVNLWD